MAIKFVSNTSICNRKNKGKMYSIPMNIFKQIHSFFDNLGYWQQAGSFP